MKKIFVSVIFLYTAVLVNAQSTPADSSVGRWDLGISVAPSVSSLTGEGALYDQPLFGFGGGISAQFNISKRFAIKTGLFYDQKGSSSTASFTDSARRTYSFDNRDVSGYLELPLLARLYLGKKHTFFINAGPYFSYLLNETTYYSSVDNGTPHSSSVKYISNNNFDAGFTIGTGMDKKVTDRLFIEIELRGSGGFVNLAASPPPGSPFSSSAFTVYNESLNLLLGVKYRL